MVRTLVICVASFILFSACNKSSSNATTTVEYQVSATNSSNIDINYNNVLGNKISVSAQNSWVFDVVIDKKPFTAYIQAASASPFSSITTTCTVNILVNGTIVKTATISSNTVATAEAEYTVQ
jgi:hypothetical protein